MALDLPGAALNFDVSALLSSVDEVHARGWKTVSNDKDKITLVKAHHGQLGFGLHNDSVYALLEARGVLCVAGEASNDEVMLSGGSVSACRLHLGKRLVTKHVQRSALQEIDDIQRHAAEAQWIASTTNKRPELFPAVAISRSANSLSIISEFFPAYTLGEFLMQGRLDFDAACHLVARAFLAMSPLYDRPLFTGSETYAEKVSRRISWLLLIAEPPRHLSLMHIRGAQINGRNCRPIGDLLRLIESDDRLAAVIRCEHPRSCHGDFIPEDILYCAPTDRMQFIDPNPQIQDPLADLAKMVMSTLVNYDLAIRDKVHSEVNIEGDKVTISTWESEGFVGYVDLQHRMLSWILEDPERLVGRNIIERHRLVMPSILLHAGLQAMALTIFHYLHHRKEPRAIYFLAKGHAATEAAVTALLQSDGKGIALADLRPF